MMPTVLRSPHLTGSRYLSTIFQPIRPEGSQAIGQFPWHASSQVISSEVKYYKICEVSQFLRYRPRKLVVTDVQFLQTRQPADFERDAPIQFISKKGQLL